MVFQVFDSLDAIVVGEARPPTSSCWRLWTRTAADDAPHIRLHPRYGAVRALPMLHYEKLSTVPTPDFSRLPWDSTQPEPFVYYSPSRGCYWNKCTFCDYGLNTDGPTSPWRQDTVDTMIRDVTELSKFAKFIYFSVDVLAPATILRFAEQVVDRGLDFRGGAEIRLEKYGRTSGARCSSAAAAPPSRSGSSRPTSASWTSSTRAPGPTASTRPSLRCRRRASAYR
ncbi:hypothetical protein GCM10020218_002250 [Dactylosporangium vinaceum]